MCRLNVCLALAVPTVAPGLSSRAQARPEMFQASFILHAFGNDATNGTAPPYTANTWAALPLGYDCQYGSSYISQTDQDSTRWIDGSYDRL